MTSKRSSAEDTMEGEPQERDRQVLDNSPTGDPEKGVERSQTQPVGFWDPSLNAVRKEVLLRLARTTVILMVFILSVLSLYWAVLYRVEENLSALKVAIVDFDGQIAPYTNTAPLVGPMIVQMGEEQARTTAPHLGFESHFPSQYNNDPIAVRQAVYDEHFWAAIIINANATAMLQEAVETGNAAYDPLGACQIVYIEARDQTAVDTYIIPSIQQFTTQATSAFGEMWAGRVLGNSTISRSNISRAPQALSPAIGFSTFNLRPFGPAAATPAVTIGLIYLIIIAFFSFGFYLPIHIRFLKPEGQHHPPLHFWQLVLWRWSTTVISYLFLALAYSLVSLAFQIPFSRPPAPDTVVATSATAYHHGTFPVYWMLNFFGMIALGLASENVTMVIGQPWTALWLIFWVITNVCTSFYEIKLEPRFFYWGYAWPLHNIVQASRTILFGTHSKIGLNFGVLIAWGTFNTALFPFASTFMRWKTLKGEGKRPTWKEVLR